MQQLLHEQLFASLTFALTAVVRRRRKDLDYGIYFAFQTVYLVFQFLQSVGIPLYQPAQLVQSANQGGDAA